MISGREKHLGLTTRRVRCFFLCLNKERKSHISVDYKQGEWKQTQLFFSQQYLIKIIGVLATKKQWVQSILNKY